MLHRGLRGTRRVFWIARLCALLVRLVERRAGRVAGRRTVGCAAGVAVHDRAQIHCDGTRGVTTTTRASRVLSRGTRDWRWRHPDSQPWREWRNWEVGGSRGGTKRKGEVLAPDRANREAWEDHRRFGEERGKATMSTLAPSFVTYAVDVTAAAVDVTML